MNDGRERLAVPDEDPLFVLIEILNERDECVWAKMIRLSTSDAHTIRSAQLGEAAVVFERVHEVSPI